MTKFYQIFENCSKNSIKLYTRVQFFFVYFLKRWQKVLQITSLGRNLGRTSVGRRRRRKRMKRRSTKKRFFKSAENFRYGKASKLNMLAFRKKIQTTLLWLWKFILILKKLTKFYQIFENCSKNSIKLYTRVQIFFAFFFKDGRKFCK